LIGLLQALKKSEPRVADRVRVDTIHCLKETAPDKTIDLPNWEGKMIKMISAMI
jgi:hypothetical protein